MRLSTKISRCAVSEARMAAVGRLFSSSRNVVAVSRTYAGIDKIVCLGKQVTREKHTHTLMESAIR